MCRLIPFSLPCCRRMYVEVGKLTCCPPNWPDSKCPPDLCIVVGDGTADERDHGICWRCAADRAGKFGQEREAYRPRIDGARIVKGLDGITLPERRRLRESQGRCWSCGAKKDCTACSNGAKSPASEHAHGRNKTASAKRERREMAAGETQTATQRQFSCSGIAGQARTPNPMSRPSNIAYVPQTANSMTLSSNDYIMSRTQTPDPMKGSSYEGVYAEDGIFMGYSPQAGLHDPGFANLLNADWGQNLMASVLHPPETLQKPLSNKSP